MINKLRAGQFILLLIVSIVAFFSSINIAFAGTLTNFSYSTTSMATNATADYTFSYTVETADPNMIIYVSWPAGFDISSSIASVLINGAPATISEFAKFSNLTYIRLDTGASPVVSGASIETTISNVVNPATPGTYNFGWVFTADPGGNALDEPLTLQSIVIENDFAGGVGTVQNPYQIATCTQLEKMNDYTTSHFVLVNNIDCSGSENWNGGEGFDPVGDLMVPFIGSFDGDGYTINFLTINRPTISGVGLFGAVGNGVTLRNIWLENVSITGGQYTGAIVGNFGIDEGTRSLLEKSYAQGSVTGTSSMVGGLVGAAYSLDLENSYFRGDVSADFFDVGGLVGYSQALRLENSYSAAVVTSVNNTPYALVGWLAGNVPGVIVGSFWSSDIAGNIQSSGSTAGGTNITLAQMQTTSTFTNAAWDFNTIWNRTDGINNGFPNLRQPGQTAPLEGEGTIESPWQITECLVVVDSGYYVLVNDIENVEGDCIVIEASNVEIDGDEYAIIGFENLGDQAIFSQGYNQINIRNIELDNFQEGIQIFDVEGPSSIVNSNITNMSGDAIDIRGATEMDISNNTISDIQSDGMDIDLYEFDDIENNNITIHENTITRIGSTAIEVSWLMGGSIVNNTISEIDNDGIYLSDATDVSIRENNITHPLADGIDIDKDIDNNNLFITDIEVLDNMITSAGDSGIEISNLAEGIVSGNTIIKAADSGISLFDVSQTTITENTISAFVKGIEMNNSDNNVITANNMSLSSVEGFGISEIAYSFVNTNPEVAENASAGDVYTDFGDYIISGDDQYFQYDLPFVFNYQGRNIRRISVNTNGFVELLEEDENCGGGSLVQENVSFDCDQRGSYQALLYGDVIFANMDDLYTGDSESDYLGIFNIENESVVIEWFGVTYFDYNENAYTSETHPIHFQVVLHSDGTIDWNMKELKYDTYTHNFFTGAYDGESSELYIAGFGLDEELISYSGDFSGNGSFEPTAESFDFTALILNNSNTNTITGNFFTATTWVDNNSNNNIFNTSNTGNTYYFSTGRGAWTQFDIKDTNNDGFAEVGADRPFSQETLGQLLWNGNGQDSYPGTETRRVARERSGSFMSSLRTTQNNSITTQSNTTVSQLPNNKQCPPDQILTQNLRSGARDGRFHPYTGATVREAKILQAHLNRLGFNSGPVDGILGPISDGAIKRMQTFLGTKPDGFVGPITRAVLNNSCQ